ncbi:MAG: ABC transporter permease [Bacteroidales bacterium]|jgi:putative ABC transport system permease protein
MNLLFFKLAFRNILRNKLYSLINIIGLSIGIATILFIFLFLRTETTFDNFHPDGKRLFRIIETSNSKNDHLVAGFTGYPNAPEIAASIPGIDSFCRASEVLEVKCFRKDQIFKIKHFRYADDNFFSFFSFRLITGDPATILNSAEKIVLSHRMAIQIFGNDDPLGQNLIINQKVFTISGISEDIPGNTHLKFDALVSIKYVENDKENFWLGWAGGLRFLSYLKLTLGVSSEQVEAGLPALLYEKINKRIEGSGTVYSDNLQNIRDIHISTGGITYDCPDNRSKSSIMIISGIGLLILLLALINYISLYIAQKSEKIKSIILLTIHGAGRWQLTIQAFIEVMIMSFISTISGIYLLTLLIPLLNDFLNTSITLNQNPIPSLLFLIGVILTVSLIITLFSTHNISQINVTEVIKGCTIPEGRNKIMSTFLVTIQFIIVILFIVSILVMNKQNTYVNNVEYGFTKENILSIFPGKEFKHNELSGFRQELLGIAGISNVSLTSESVGKGLTMNGYQITGESEMTMLNVIYADARFLDCFGIKLISGRNFKEETQQDLNSILVNQKLVQRAGWKDPINQTIDRNGLMTVIGTVEDFNFASLYSQIKPLIIMCNPAYDGWGYNCVNIRYQTTDIRALSEKIRLLWERDFPGITYEISFLNDQLTENYKSLEDQQRIVSFFSIMSIIIACMGLFGLTSFIARRRTREIGIRRINGGKISEMIMMLNTSFLNWIIWAIIIAIPFSWYAMHKWLQQFAYKIELSWWIFGLACLMVLCIALLTVSWQSFRAATRNPVEALRYE